MIIVILPIRLVPGITNTAHAIIDRNEQRDKSHRRQTVLPIHPCGARHNDASRGSCIETRPDNDDHDHRGSYRDREYILWQWFQRVAELRYVDRQIWRDRRLNWPVINKPSSMNRSIGTGCSTRLKTARLRRHRLFRLRIDDPLTPSSSDRSVTSDPGIR